MRFVRPLTDEEIAKLEAMRRSAVGRVSQRAQMLLLSNKRRCIADIARTFDASENTIRQWIVRFETEGIDCLDDRPRSGRPPKVKAASLPTIEEDLLTPPRSLGYRFNSWTLFALTRHIAQKLGIELSIATARRLMKALGFAKNCPRLAPKPGIDTSVKQKLAAILEALTSRVSGNHVIYADESDVHLLPNIRSMWMKTGQQTRVPTPGTNKKRSIFGALNIRTGEWIHKTYERKRSAEFIEFLTHICKAYPTGRIHIILDNYSIHKSRSVVGWIGSHPRVKLYYLPCYMPELNPVEKIWWRMKGVVTANRLYGSIDNLIEAVDAFFEDLSASDALTLAA